MDPPRSARRKVLGLVAATCLPLVAARRSAATSASTQHALDADGVAMLFPDAGGAPFHLGRADPNRSERFVIERNTPAIPIEEDGVRGWRIHAHTLRYTSGGIGRTARLHVRTSDRQRHSWRDTPGWLGTPQDYRNQEFTAYVRLQEITEPKRAAVSLKIRGGEHTSARPENASCAMMTFQSTHSGAVTRFGKELTHPLYDYVKLEPRFHASLVERRWFGLKLVSYADPIDANRVVNRLYLDATPFDADAVPSNGWRLFSEYIDIAGRRTGRYERLVDWGGWQTTLRTDGIGIIDFALLSVREIHVAAVQDAAH